MAMPITLWLGIPVVLVAGSLLLLQSVHAGL
jgi:hypothetical protein